MSWARGGWFSIHGHEYHIYDVDLSTGTVYAYLDGLPALGHKVFSDLEMFGLATKIDKNPKSKYSTKCECGAWRTYGKDASEFFHSTWCALHKRP